MRVRYDFAVDGGAQGALDILEADGPIIITDFHMIVVTAGTSDGSATVKVGVTGDDDSFVKTTEGAVASLTANALFKAKPELTLTLSEGTPNTVSAYAINQRVPHRLADGEKVLMTIGTADLTAGVFDFVIGVMKA